MDSGTQLCRDLVFSEKSNEPRWMETLPLYLAEACMCSKTDVSPGRRTP